MALEKRANSSNRYYYRSVRIDQRVRKVYCGREGTLAAVSAELMIMERSLMGRDQKSLDSDFTQARRSVALLVTEAKSLMHETLVLAGYDGLCCRRLSRRPGRPRRTGPTLRQRHESILKSVDIQAACRLAAFAIDRLARVRQESNDQLCQQLCRDVMEDASEIAGADPLPAEQILAIAIVLSRELVDISEHYCEVMGLSRTRWRAGPNPSTAEAMLIRLRRQLERVT